MFRCQKCGTIVASGIRSKKVVVKTREKTYEAREPVRARNRYARRKNRHKKKQNYDRGGHGYETVRELTVCPECAKKFAETTV